MSYPNVCLYALVWVGEVGRKLVMDCVCVYVYVIHTHTYTHTHILTHTHTHLDIH